MKIGFIVGKDDEIYNDDFLYDITPKKYLQYDNLNTDDAICTFIKYIYYCSNSTARQTATLLIMLYNIIYINNIIT